MVIYLNYPYSVRDQDFRELANLGIRQTCEKIHVQLEYSNLPTKHGRESDQHRALKKFAARLLEELGEYSPNYEHAYYDVYGPALHIIVECGDTTLDKILDAFFRWFRKDLRELWTLDYPNSEGQAELIKFIKVEGGERFNGQKRTL
jgi:hypothetical protein